MKLRAIGQATFVVTLADGQVIVLDPWFGEHRLAPRAIPLPEGWNEPPDCAAMIVSHHHVDSRSLRAARRRGATVVGPSSVIRRARLAGVRNRRTLRRGEVVVVDGWSVEGVFASHPLCVAPIGLLLRDADGTTLYHSGDTRFDDRIVSDLAGRRVDVACLQIAAARYPGLGRDGMNVADAARLTRTLGPAVAVPMHYHVHGKTVDPQRFADEVGSRARVLAPGEETEVTGT